MRAKQETTKTISAAEFDRRFDEGEDMSEFLDWSTMRRPDLGGKRINIDLPNDFLEALDKEAMRRGITRQSLIKTWLYERLHGEALLAIHAAEVLTSSRAGVAPAKGKRKVGVASGLRPQGLVDILSRQPTTITAADILDELSKRGFRVARIRRRELSTKKLKTEPEPKSVAALEQVKRSEKTDAKL
jgi:CopG antitoxin of type II toxin-antitoxin system